MPTFLILGAHLSENLEHHKTSDVIRILEDKGFAENDGSIPNEILAEKGFKDAGGIADDDVHIYVPAGGSANGLRTIVLFDKGGFVRADGVRFYE